MFYRPEPASWQPYRDCDTQHACVLHMSEWQSCRFRGTLGSPDPSAVNSTWLTATADRSRKDSSGQLPSCTLRDTITPSCTALSSEPQEPGEGSEQPDASVTYPDSSERQEVGASPEHLRFLLRWRVCAESLRPETCWYGRPTMPGRHTYLYSTCFTFLRPEARCITT